MSPIVVDASWLLCRYHRDLARQVECLGRRLHQWKVELRWRRRGDHHDLPLPFENKSSEELAQSTHWNAYQCCESTTNSGPKCRLNVRCFGKSRWNRVEQCLYFRPKRRRKIILEVRIHIEKNPLYLFSTGLTKRPYLRGTKTSSRSATTSIFVKSDWGKVRTLNWDVIKDGGWRTEKS